MKPGEVIDHINGDGLDNRRANLRVGTQQQNVQNMHTKRGMRGVSWNKSVGKWIAHVTHDYKFIHLGCFTDKDEAQSVADAKRRELWGVPVATIHVLTP